MSEMNKTQELAEAARKLESVRAEMETTVQRVQSRVRNFRVLAIVIAILLAVYFFFAYSKIRQVNAEMAVSNVEFHLQQRMPQARKDLEKALAERAPDVVETGIDQLMESPQLLRGTLSQFIVGELEKKLQEVEQPLYESLQEQVRLIAQRAREVKADPNNKEQTAKLVDELTAAYRKEAQREFDKLLGFYQEKADELVSYLTLLAQNQGLNPTERLHRELVMTLLALVQKLNPDIDILEVGS